MGWKQMEHRKARSPRMSTPKWGNYASGSALLASEKITEDEQSSISTATDKALGRLFRSPSEWPGRQGSFLGVRKRCPVGPRLNFAVCGYALCGGLALCTRRPKKTPHNSTQGTGRGGYGRLNDSGALADASACFQDQRDESKKAPPEITFNRDDIIMALGISQVEVNRNVLV